MERQAQSGVGWSSLTASELAEVRGALDRILASSSFAASPRRSRLLRYLVERALSGTSEQTTEYGIGLDVFDRPASFDPRIDSIVRTETSRLRQKLRDYYLGEGANDLIVIEIPSRSYVPSITFREKPEAALRTPAPEPESPPTPPRRRSSWLALWLFGAAVVIGLTLALALRWNRPLPAPITSLVVLPFQNFSGNSNAEYLADGVTEELTNELAQQRELRVLARTSAFAFKGKGVDIREIGRKLNVGAAIEGSIAKKDNTLRITAQLIRTSDGYHLWSHAYEVPYRDLATAQTQITDAVEKIVLSHAPAGLAAGNPSDPEAHDLYLQATYQLSLQTPESFAKSLAMYQTAVEKDPRYVSAYRGIARAEVALIHITASAPRPAIMRARAALEKALEINPDDPETLGQLAGIDYVYDWDWPRAQGEFRLAVDRGAQATTHSYYGWALSTRGDFAEAHRQLQIAHDLDPLGAGPRFNEAMAFILEHRFSDAKRLLQESIDARISLLDTHTMLGAIAVYEHDCDAAATNFEWDAQHSSLPIVNVGLSFLASCRGQNEQARGLLARAAAEGPAAFASPYQFAMGYAFIHDKEAALAYLEKSAEAREGQIFYLKYEPAFNEIRADARFLALEKKVGLE